MRKYGMGIRLLGTGEYQTITVGDLKRALAVIPNADHAEVTFTARIEQPDCLLEGEKAIAVDLTLVERDMFIELEFN